MNYYITFYILYFFNACFSSCLCTEYQVVINLHHKGTVISSRETNGGSCSVWNASFLFDLPPGDITQLPVMLEFIITQVQMALGDHNHIMTCTLWMTTFIFLVTTLWIPHSAPLLWIRCIRTVKFSAESLLVRRLQMQDELTGGTCAVCRWSRHAGTTFNQSLYRDLIQSVSLWKPVLTPVDLTQGVNSVEHLE